MAYAAVTAYIALSHSSTTSLRYTGAKGVSKMCPANYWWSAKGVTIFVWCDNCGISEAVRRNECMQKVENYANSIVRIMNFLQLFFASLD